jgi:trehalose 6-phosphate synthase
MNLDNRTARVERSTGTDQLIDDLVLVSNRQPYRHTYADDGSLTVDEPAGGLTTGMDSVMQRVAGTWVAWGDGDADFDVTTDEQVGVPQSDPSYTLHRVRLSSDQVQGYYEGYANQALWPLCHSMADVTTFDRDHWEQYRAVNELFADVVADHVSEGTIVWFQDYHFGLAARHVRESTPDAFQMQFLHIPWPAPGVFRISPQAEALLDGLLVMLAGTQPAAPTSWAPWP